jgi:hypothetical protein
MTSVLVDLKCLKLFNASELHLVEHLVGAALIYIPCLNKEREHTWADDAHVLCPRQGTLQCFKYADHF